jgi:hypothetical protein
MQLIRDNPHDLFGTAAREPWSCDADLIQRQFSLRLRPAFYADVHGEI